MFKLSLLMLLAACGTEHIDFRAEQPESKTSTASEPGCGENCEVVVEPEQGMPEVVPPPTEAEVAFAIDQSTEETTEQDTVEETTPEVCTPIVKTVVIIRYVKQQRGRRLGHYRNTDAKD